MKLNATTLPVETSLENATSAFSIKTTAKAFKILSDGLYKNKILAFVRELSRNAYDAQIAAGRKNVPFEIHLPNMLEPFFHVKDFGTGLSHENVIHLYTTYFESTKTDSNDFVGALGLGSKSPFSYASNFTVKSRFDGVESIYTCFLSEAGVPSIVKMGEGKYTGHPGLEVVIPIDKNDFNSVKTAVRQDLTFWEGTLPTIVGDSSFVVDQPSKVVTGKGWYTTGSRIQYGGVVVAVQGNVGYPVAIDLLRSKTKSDAETAALNIIRKINPVITFEIGKLDVTASREELSYDEPTIRNLIERISQVIVEFTEKFKSELNDVTKETTELTFRHKAYNLIQRYSSSYGSDFITFYSGKVPHVTWNNRQFTLKDLTDSDFSFYIKGFSNCTISNSSSRFRGNRERFTRTPIGEVVYFNASEKVDLSNVKEKLTGNTGWGRNYNLFNYWDVHRKVNPRRMRDSKTSYDNHVTTNRGGTTFTRWTIPFFHNGRYSYDNTVIILNDQQSFGHQIVGQYMVENPRHAVYVIDYSRRVVSANSVKSFINDLMRQLSGLKILSTSQLTLKNPPVKPVRGGGAKTLVVKNLDDVTLFTETTTNVPQANLRAKSFAYASSYNSGIEFKFARPFISNTDTSVDFSTGDFYYFYELRNKMYLDEGFNTRVDPTTYLNALLALGILPSGSRVVGLRPPQIKKIVKNKRRGKMIPISTLDKKLFETIRTNQLLVDVYSISKLGSQIANDSTVSELFQGETTLNALNAKYGDITTGKTKIALFDQLSPVLKIFTASQNLNVRKAATVLEMIHYYSSGNDKYYTDAWTKIFKDINVEDKVKEIKERISATMTEFNRKNPLFKFLSFGMIRYSSNKEQVQVELIDEVIKYVESNASKKV